MNKNGKPNLTIYTDQLREVVLYGSLRLRLETAGADWDGTIRPINAMSYEPLPEPEEPQ